MSAFLDAAAPVDHLEPELSPIRGRRRLRGGAERGFGWACFLRLEMGPLGLSLDSDLQEGLWGGGATDSHVDFPCLTPECALVCQVSIYIFRRY